MSLKSESKNMKMKTNAKNWRQPDRRTRSGPKRRLAMGAVIAGVLLLGTMALAADASSASTAADEASSYKIIGLSIAAAVSVSASILGAGYAVGRIGSAAMGAIAEKPELLPRAMLFVALGEGLAVLGFAFAIWLLLRM